MVMFARTLAGLQQVQDAAEAVQGAIESINGGLAESTRTVLAEAQQAVSDGKNAIDAELDGIRQKTVEVCEGTARDLKTLVDDVKKRRKDAADELDDLVNLVKDAKSEWQKELKLGLDALFSGAITFRKFLDQYGDMVRQLDGKNKSIEEILAKVDRRQFQDKFQDLLQFVEDEGNSFDSIIDLLEKQLQGRFKNIGELLRRFEDKKLTFEELRRQLEGLQEFFGGSDLDHVIDELLDRLQEENRR